MTASTRSTSDDQTVVDLGRAALLDKRPLSPTLREAATHLILPDGIVRTLWPRVKYRLATMGVTLDRWQEGFCQAALGLREDESWACGVDGVCASIPRQVGKTFLISHVLIALCIEFPGLRCVWTSHHARTTTGTFRSVQGAVRRPAVAAHLKKDRSGGIRTANGEQEIEFAGGSIIMFGARALGFGRGMQAIDVEVFDEAQILGLKALEDMVPATNAAKNPHGGLLFFIGTPPRPVDDGAAFTAKRAAALAGDAPDGMWVEISGDEDLDPYSPKQYRRANPSYPHRVGATAMKRMQKNLPDLGAWQREALGIWPKDVVERVLPEWPERAGAGPAADTAPDAFGVDRAESGEISVCAAWATESGVHGEEVFSTRSLEAAAAFLDEAARPRDQILFDEHSPARALMPLLKRRRMRGAKIARVGDLIAACALVEAGIDEQTLTHAGQEVLARGIANAMKRPIKTSSGGWVWASRGDNQPIHALNAFSLAVLGASQTLTGGTSGGREAVVV
ncbi:terminase [Gordonia sp. PP30]|uniref:terminase n=1 Tax=Gordonia sp. PP30 TaxID=2935861 RepID=UPI001FFFB1B5|nr:terminase [Gordonia sp. PP30]UQE73850.1 terminase [Gordonia sp. PP30]